MKNSSRRRVLLVVPRLTRDLEGHALVAYHLREHFECDVELLTGPGTEQRFLEYVPDALVLDVVGFEDRLQQAKMAKAAGARVCVLPTAGVFPDERGFLHLAGEANGGCRLVDCYLSWGEFAASAIRSRGLIEQDRVEVTGCPRFDFYADDRLGRTLERPAFCEHMGIRNAEAPIVLWCTNTNNYNPKSGNVERFVRSAREHGKFSEQQLRTEIKDERRQFETHSQLILNLAARHPEWTFLVKIHPLENRRFYSNWARGAANVVLAPDIPFREFVFHCDILLQRGCTTATEFWTINKPVLELQIGTYEITWAPREHTNGNHSVFSEHEAAIAIGQYLGGALVPLPQVAARRAYLQKFYYRIDGGAAFRCAARIYREISGSAYGDEDQKRTQQKANGIAAQREQDLRSARMSRIRRTVGLAPDRTLRFWKRSFWSNPARITPEVVASLYERYRRALSGNRSQAAESFSTGAL